MKVDKKGKNYFICCGINGFLGIILALYEFAMVIIPLSSFVDVIFVSSSFLAFCFLIVLLLLNL